MENSIKVPQNTELSYDPAIPCLGIHPDKTVVLKDIGNLMFTAALFTIVKTCKQSKCPLTEDWIKKMWYTYTMEYYSDLKKNEIMPSAETWMDYQSK